MFQNINLNFLKYYYEVANAKNITKASEILNISQPALTKAIKELENELNTTLLIRNKKGVVLTEQGKILYEYTKVMLQKLQTAISTIDNPKEYEKNIYIGTTTTNFLEPILPILKELKRKYSNIQIHIFLEEIDVLENYRKLGKMDIIIKNDYEVINNLEKIKSFSIQDSFISSRKDFPEIENKIFTLEEILEYPLVLLSKITHGRRNFDAFLKSQGLTSEPCYEFNSYSLCKELIKNGFGIGIGNPIHYKSQNFIILKTDFSLPERFFDICVTKNSDNQLLEEVISLIKKHFK